MRLHLWTTWSGLKCDDCLQKTYNKWTELEVQLRSALLAYFRDIAVYNYRITQGDPKVNG